MTREEAIQELMTHIEHWERLKTERIAPKEEAERTAEAFNMAIEALKVDPVRCGECKHRASGKMGKMCYGRYPDDFCSYGERSE